MQKTVTIELKVRYKDDTRFDHVRKVAARTARQLVAAAQLISDGHQPQIAVTTFDPFDGKEGIDFMSDVYNSEDEE